MITAADVETYEQHDAETGRLLTGWWSARCKHCRQRLTAHDFTRESAIRIALSEPHECRRTP